MLKLIFYLLFIIFLPSIFGDLLYDTVIKNPLRPGCFHPLCQINVVRATTTQGAIFGYSIWFYEFKWINYFLGVPYADRPLAGQGNRFKVCSILFFFMTFFLFQFGLLKPRIYYVFYFYKAPSTSTVVRFRLVGRH